MASSAAQSTAIAIVFRHKPAQPEPPAAGELRVRPALPADRERRDLSVLVLESGLDALERSEGPVTSITVSQEPTLDDMLAATFAQLLLAGQKLPAGAAAFAHYARLVRKGLCPGKLPLADSLEALYLAIRLQAGKQLTEPEAASRFLSRWRVLADWIMRSAAEGVDPGERSPCAEGAEFAEERAYLAREQEVYRQDVARGERWLARVPGGPPRSAALLLRQPKSCMFKRWCRVDRDAPLGEGYLLLAVDWGQGMWVFTTDPAQRLSIASLADVLQAAERRRDPARPDLRWRADYDGTLVAAPHGGTRLAEREVLQVVRRWSGAPTRVGRRAVLAAAGAGLVCLGAAAGIVLLPDGPIDTPTANRSFAFVEEDGPESIPMWQEAATELLSDATTAVPFHLSDPTSTGHPIRLQVSVRADGPLDLRKLSVRVNDGPLQEVELAERGERAVKTVSIDAVLSPDLDGSSGRNRVRVELDRGGEASLPATVGVSWDVQSGFLPTLHLLAVGVSKYKYDGRSPPGGGQPLHNLDCADKDAEALVEAFVGQEGRLFKSVNYALLTNATADEDNVLKALAQLKQRASQFDLVVVSLAGHGVRSDDTFCFLPHDFDPAKDVRATSISWNDILNRLQGLPCNVIVILDTCHSGAAAGAGQGQRAFGDDDDAEQIASAVRESWRNQAGIVLMTACLAQDAARESARWGHGALTLAILEGLTGERLPTSPASNVRLPQESSPDAVISLADLNSYVSQRVLRELAPGQAVVTKPIGSTSLDLIPISTVPAGKRARAADATP
jgi:hypothetical protein